MLSQSEADSICVLVFFPQVGDTEKDSKIFGSFSVFKFDFTQKGTSVFPATALKVRTQSLL